MDKPESRPKPLGLWAAFPVAPNEAAELALLELSRWQREAFNKNNKPENKDNGVHPQD